MAYGLTKSEQMLLSGTQYLSQASSFGVGQLAAHTFECWIKPLSQPSSGVQYGLWTLFWANAGVRVFYQNNAGTLAVNIMRHAWFTQQTNFNWNITLTTGTWYHLAYTFDASGNTELFINGVSQGSTGLGTTTGSSLSFPSVLGNSNGNVSPEMQGDFKISLARVWDVVRTQAQISANMCNVFGTATTNMRAEWSLDNVNTDASGNGYTWTANNTPTFQTDVPSTCVVAVTSIPDARLNFI